MAPTPHVFHRLGYPVLSVPLVFHRPRRNPDPSYNPEPCTPSFSPNPVKSARVGNNLWPVCYRNSWLYYATVQVEYRTVFIHMLFLDCTELQLNKKTHL